MLGSFYTYNHTATYLYRNIYKSVTPPSFRKSWARGDVLYNWAMLKNGGKVCFTDDV